MMGALPPGPDYGRFYPALHKFSCPHPFMVPRRQVVDVFPGPQGEPRPTPR